MSASTTLKRLTEQIYLQYSGGTQNQDAKSQMQEIKYLVVEQLNRLLKQERLRETSLTDFRLPDSAAITSYTISTIVADGDYSTFSLPAQPIAAPHGMGVYEVILNDTTDSIEYEMVPIDNAYQRTFLSLYPEWNKYAPFTKSFAGATGGWYTWDGGQKVRLCGDFSTGYNIKLKLLIVDISTLADTDLLPIPADMEATVIENVLMLMRARQVEDKVMDDNTKR